MYSVKRALFAERIVRNWRQAFVQLIVRKNIIGTTKSYVNLHTNKKATSRTKKTGKNIRQLSQNSMRLGLVWNIGIAIRKMKIAVGMTVAAKAIKAKTIRNKNKLFACCLNFVQGTLTSALF